MSLLLKQAIISNLEDTAMGNPLVVDPVLSLDWLKKKKKIFGELERQLIQGIEQPGKGLTLDQLHLVTEHKSPWQAVVKKVPSRAARMQILQYISRSKVASNEKFVAADNFKNGNSAGVKFWCFGDNFKNNFLNKTEVNIPVGNLAFYKLKEASVDGPIQAELGERPETYLSDLWEMLKKQPAGQPGKLLVDGKANIFYIRDVDGTVWAVRAFWFAVNGWYVGASSVEYPYEWDDDYLVVAR